MSCCSSRRSAMTPALQLRAATAPPAAPATAPGQSLHYTGVASLALRGPSSGRIYLVGPESRQITADSRDVGALLHTGQFRP